MATSKERQQEHATHIAMKTPPRVDALTVNNGAVQRSRVDKFSVAFNEVVTLPANPADAFVLTRTGPGSPTGTVTLAGTVDNSAGYTKVNLTMSAGALYTAGSLIDGRYQVKVVASKVTDSTGLTLDGNVDGIVDQTDILNWTKFHKSGSSWYDFPVNGLYDGLTNTQDLNIIQQNLGRTCRPR